MQDFLNKKILLAVTGGIAAYKSAYLVRALQALGAEIRVIMSESAQAFISPLTFQALTANPVRSSLWDAEAERAMGHIELARWADYILVAPATANTMAKLAQGLADDLLTTLCLVAEVPVILCPAMNHSMWAHPATKANAALLESRGLHLFGPDEGSQACGEFGLGRMLEVEEIIESLRLVDLPRCLEGRHCLITAGPTREPIDPVRYLSNASSGKMGYAIARAAARAGAKVTLISGPTALILPKVEAFIPVETAAEMQAAVMQALRPDSLFIAAAAVADYRPKAMASGKIKKTATELNLALCPTEDILGLVLAEQRPAFVVGFAAETEQPLENARAKLARKPVDLLALNQVGPGLGFDSEQNQLTLLTAETEIVLPKMHKTRLAAKLIQQIAAALAETSFA